MFCTLYRERVQEDGEKLTGLNGEAEVWRSLQLCTQRFHFRPRLRAVETYRSS